MKRVKLNQITISASWAMAKIFKASCRHCRCGFCNRVAGRQNDKAPGQKTRGTRGALSSVEVLKI